MEEDNANLPKKLELKDHYLNHISEPIVKNTIVYGACENSGLVCNPMAIFRGFLADPSFTNYKHIWLIQDEMQLKNLLDNYGDNKSVTFVLSNRSNRQYYAKILATSHYFILNYNLPNFFVKRRGQVCICTWHGISLAGLSLNNIKDYIHSSKHFRNLLISDFIISPNKFMTNFFLQSFKLQNIYNGKIIQEGHPRSDIIIKNSKVDAIKILHDIPIFVTEKKKLILYAPSPQEDSEPASIEKATKIFVKTFKSFITSRDYILLILPHYSLYNHFSEKTKKTLKIIPPYVDVCEILNAVDILITDYNNIYFDFLHTFRPILFYIPSLPVINEEDIKSEQQLPGPIINDIQTLVQNIINISKEIVIHNYTHKYMKNWPFKSDDGNVSKRIVDAIFNSNYKRYNYFSLNNNKETLLLYIGDLNINSDTISFINGIDIIKYDVTLFFLKECDIDFLKSLKNEIRSYFMININNLSKENEGDVQQSKEEENSTNDNFEQTNNFKLEKAKLFGDIVFNYGIDLTQGNSWFSNILPYVCSRTIPLEVFKMEM